MRSLLARVSDLLKSASSDATDLSASATEVAWTSCAMAWSRASPNIVREEPPDLNRFFVLLLVLQDSCLTSP